MNKILIFIAFLVISGTHCPAQIITKQTSVRYQRRVDETTPITNQVTGQRLTMEQYGQLIKDDPFAWHLVPDYNENGQPTAYTLRQATPEEHETHHFRDRDPAKQPKAGQPMVPFVMTGLDGKTYRSADLLGKVVILSFWISLEKQFLSDQQLTDFTNALQPYQAENAPVILAVLNSEPTKPSPSDARSFPFVLVPNAYGFHNKYHITTIPTFVVIDKTGKVAANLQGAGSYEKLKQVLATIMK